MAVYREKRRSRVWALALLGAGLLILAAITLAVVGSRGPAPAGETPRGRAQPALRDMSDALDLFAIEYPKVVAGRPSGAPAALTRARAAWDRARPDVGTADPRAGARFETALQGVEQQAAVRAPAAAVVAAATSLRADVRAWIQSP